MGTKVEPVRPASPAALRQRRRRWRRRHNLLTISIELAPDAIDDLIRLGWLGAAKGSDKAAVAVAVVGIAGEAMKRRVAP
jgi:hypothetical protein